MRLLRKGEWLALAAAVALLVSLFFAWFGGRSGWSSAGWLMVALVIVGTGLGLWIAAATAGNVLVRILPSLVFGSAGGLVVAVVTTLRVIAFAPGDRGPGAWVAVVAAWALFAGAGIALADERTAAPQSEYTPPAPRPAPPAT